MATQFGNAKIRIELDPREAEEALARLQAKLQALDAGLSTTPGGQTTQKRDDQPSRTPRQSGDSADDAPGGGPSMRNTRPGRFGVQNLKGLLSAPGLLGAVPGIGGALRFGAELEMKYGAAAEGLIEGSTDQLLESAGMKDTFLGDVVKQLEKAVLVLQGKVRDTIQNVDAALRAAEPTADAAIQIMKAQLLVGGAIDKEFLTKYAMDMYDITYTLNRKEKDVREKTLREISEAGGQEIIKTLLEVAKR